MRYLSTRVPALKVVETAPTDRDAVYFGAIIELEDVESGEALHYRLVGPDEAEPSRGDISIDSPVARALLKKRVDDEVDVQLPAGPRRVAIVSVRYVA